MTSDSRLRLALRSLPLLIALALFAAAPALAQKRAVTPTEKAMPYWATHIDAQIAELLELDDPGRQQTGMQLVIELKQKYPELKFSYRTTAALLNAFYRADAPDNVRILALSALNATESRFAMSGLQSWIDEDAEPSERVRRLVVASLDHYYRNHPGVS